ncbi:MAG: response regulator transcription factor [Elusimicrobia bacterium]|nr:response regulator transcription factor [Elusimicrobiota bacterium]
MGERILVIDDDKQLLQAVKTWLEKQDLTVSTASGGKEGLNAARETRPSLVLTDADLPDLDGHAVCRLLKQDPATRSLPVIIMSGTMMEERDIIAGLEGGADDYVLKPFPMRVLIARIRAVLRRFHPEPQAAQTLKARGIVLDPEAREAKIQGKAVQLTRKEFDLLAVLLEKPGRVLTPSFLLEAVWGYDLADYNDPHTVETHVSRLRKKIGSDRIENVSGVGYKFVP